MEEIDITSTEYSLDKMPDMKQFILETLEQTLEPTAILEGDYTFIVIIIMLIAIVAFFAYKFYLDKQKRVTFQDKLDDCYGGVCHRV